VAYSRSTCMIGHYPWARTWNRLRSRPTRTSNLVWSADVFEERFSLKLDAYHEGSRRARRKTPRTSGTQRVAGDR
jgi:hypothetical protein